MFSGKSKRFDLKYSILNNKGFIKPHSRSQEGEILQLVTQG